MCAVKPLTSRHCSAPPAADIARRSNSIWPLLFKCLLTNGKDPYSAGFGQGVLSCAS
jgi:hypothetical protein